LQPVSRIDLLDVLYAGSAYVLALANASAEVGAWPAVEELKISD